MNGPDFTEALEWEEVGLEPRGWWAYGCETETNMKIVTSFIYPPIPIRSHDWCAYDSDLDDGAPDGSRSPTGYGETEAEALRDLIPELVEHYETAAYSEGRKDQAEDERRSRIEEALRALNETGQGEHMGLTT